MLARSWLDENCKSLRDFSFRQNKVLENGQIFKIPFFGQI